MADERWESLKRRREELISTYGWMVQTVFPTQEMPGPFFAYSIGLTDKGLPEVLEVGLPGEVGGQLINDVAQMLLNEPQLVQQLPLKKTHPRWPAPFYLLAADTALAKEYGAQAWYRSAERATFIQIVWPDKYGKWPWEEGCSRGVVEMQPVVASTEALPGPPTH
jgi:hypothetical protein